MVDDRAEIEVAVVTEADAAADSADEIAVETEIEDLDETGLARIAQSDLLPVATASQTSESDSKSVRVNRIKDPCAELLKGLYVAKQSSRNPPSFSKSHAGSALCKCRVNGAQ